MFNFHLKFYMKYQNVMLTIISACLVIITLYVSGIIHKEVDVVVKGGVSQVSIIGVGVPMSGEPNFIGSAIPVKVVEMP